MLKALSQPYVLVVTEYAEGPVGLNDFEVAPAINTPALYHWLPLAEDDNRLPAVSLVIIGAVGLMIEVTNDTSERDLHP